MALISGADETLRIGDVITLYSDETGGYVFAQDAINRFVVSWPTPMESPDLPNILGSAFEILPPEKYKAAKRFAKILEQMDNRNTRRTLTSLMASNPELSSAKKLADAENEDNLLERKRQMGKPVIYANTIQLRHKLTGKYLRVSTRDTAFTENTNMLVDLGDIANKHARFRIMPRYKVRAEGDAVRMSDKVMLESMKSTGTYIHCASERIAAGQVYAGRYEVNLSVTQSSLTLRQFQRRSADAENYVHAGDTLRLLHKESAGYVATEGNPFLGPIEMVHLRVRPLNPKKPHTLYPPTSASTYWQIEIDGDPTRGLGIRWESLCRLRHFPTKRYLAVVSRNGTPSLALVKDRNDANAVFRLHAVVKEQLEIQYDAYTRIEHPLSGTWLHADPEPYKRRRYESMADKEGLEGLHWDDASLLHLTCSKTSHYDDAFIIQRVEERDELESNFISGILPVIHSYTQNRVDGVELSLREHNSITTTLLELQQYVFIDGIESKRRQKQFRHLLLLDMLMVLVVAPTRGSGPHTVSFAAMASTPRFKKMLSIVGLVNDLLDVYLLGDSRKNENYLARYIPLLFEELPYGRGFHAASTLAELVRDNRNIVDRIKPKDIDFFLTMLKKQKDPLYLRFLGVICWCEEVAIRNNQDYIVERMLIRGKDDGLIFYTDVSNGGIVVRTSVGATPVPLSRFCKLRTSPERRQETGLTGIEAYSFLVTQLDLFAKLCSGRNANALRVITEELEYLSWNETFTGMTDTELPDDLRGVYCDSISQLFVDVGTNRDSLERVQLTYAWKTLTPRPYEDSSADRRISTTGSQLNFVPQLMTWVEQFLTENMGVIAGDPLHNKLLSSVLHLVYLLVSFGFYSSQPDIAALLRPLFGLLDGRNDVHDVDQRGDNLDEWRAAERFSRNDENLAVANVKTKAMDVFHLLMNFRFNVRMQQFLFDYKTMVEEAPSTARPDSSIFNPLNIGRRLRNTSGPDLSTLARLVRGPVNKKEAVDYLQYLFGRTDYLDRSSDGTQVTTLLHDLSRYDFDEMVNGALDLLDRVHSQHADLFEQAVRAQVLVMDTSIRVRTTAEQYASRLRRLMNAKLNQKQEVEVMGMLEELSAFAVLEDDASEPHTMNQVILVNTGLLDDLLDLVAINIDLRQVEYANMAKINGLAFRLMQRLARKNAPVQERLFHRLDMLLAHRGTERAMALCVAEIFTSNRDMCLKVRESHVHQVVRLLAEFQLPQFLELLTAIVKIEELNLPLKRNQNFVVKYMMQYRKRVILKVSNEENEERLEMLRDRSITSDLLYHLPLVDLFSTCAEDENRFIESVCQTIFDVDELFQVLLDKHIPMARRRPYLRFFLWVFVSSSGSLVELGLGDLASDRRISAFLAECVPFVRRLALNIDERNQEAKRTGGKVKRQRSVLNEVSHSARGSSVLADGSGSSGGDVEADFNFVVEGLSPFLVHFCKRVLRNPADIPNELQLVFAELLSPLVTLAEVCESFIDDAEEVELLAQALVVVSARCDSGDPTTKARVRAIAATTSSASASHMSPVMVKYEKQYERELKLNRDLNKFVENLRLSYAPIENVVYDYRDSLPRSDEFQYLVREFVVYHEETRRLMPTHMHLPLMGGEIPPGRHYGALVQVMPNSAKLVQTLRNSLSMTYSQEKERVRADRLGIKTMQVLRAMVANENGRVCDERKFTEEDKVKALKFVQTRLNDFGATRVVIEFLSSTNNDVVREALLLLVALLQGGNQAVQATFSDYFLNTREERFFNDIRDRITRSRMSIKERQALRDLFLRVKRERDTVMADMHANNGQDDDDDEDGGEMLMTSSRKSSKSSNARMSKRVGIASNDTMETIEMRRMRDSSMGDPDAVLQLGGAKKKKKKKGSVASAAAEDDGFDIADDGYIETVLRLLQLLCEGQNQTLKDYLRDQEDNFKRINLVQDTVFYLAVIHTNINASNIDLCIQVLETLIEFASGNEANQETIFDAQIVDIVNQILRQNAFKGVSISKVSHLKRASAQLIFSMVEDNSPRCRAMAHELYASLDLAAVHDNMTRYYHEHELRALLGYEVGEFAPHPPVGRSDDAEVQAILKAEQTPDDDEEAQMDPIETGFSMFFVLQRMQDFVGEDKGIDMSQRPQSASDRARAKSERLRGGPKRPALSLQAAEDHLRKAHTSINQAQAHKAFLSIDFSQLPSEYRYFDKRVGSIEILREGSLQKVYFPLRNTSALNGRMKDWLLWSLDRASPSDKVRDFLDKSEILLNEMKHQEWLQSNPITGFFSRGADLWRQMVLLLTIILNIIMLATYVAPVNYDDHTPVTPDWVPSAIYGLGAAHLLFSVISLIQVALDVPPNLPEPEETQFAQKVFFLTRIVNWCVDKLMFVFSLRYIRGDILYYVALCVFSVLGIVLHGYFFSLHLLHQIVRNDLLQRVIQAVTKNGKSLLWVAALGFSIIYIYSVAAFVYLRKEFVHADGLYCDTLWQCFVTSLNQGLRAGGGLGDVLLPDYFGFDAAAVHAIFDITFYLIVTIIMLNIVFGIIVDSFSQLRDEKWAATEDMEGSCTICSLKAYDFDRIGKGFKYHTKREHSMWNYLFYFVYLDNKSSTEYNANEAYVQAKRKAGAGEAAEFFPLNRALSLAQTDDAMSTALAAVQASVDKLVERFEQVDKIDEDKAEKERQARWFERESGRVGRL